MPESDAVTIAVRGENDSAMATPYPAGRRTLTSASRLSGRLSPPGTSGYRQRVRRILSPRWLAVHASVALLVVLFCRLGWWQWDRARATGGVQNLIYALQWPSFAIFGLVMWWKTIRDELNPRAARAREAAKAEVTARRQAVAAAEPEDDELAAYNRYLAWLNQRDEQQLR